MIGTILLVLGFNATAGLFFLVGVLYARHQFAKRLRELRAKYHEGHVVFIRENRDLGVDRGGKHDA